MLFSHQKRNLDPRHYMHISFVPRPRRMKTFVREGLGTLRRLTKYCTAMELSEKILMNRIKGSLVVVFRTYQFVNRTDLRVNLNTCRTLSNTLASCDQEHIELANVCLLSCMCNSLVPQSVAHQLRMTRCFLVILPSLHLNCQHLKPPRGYHQ